MSVIIPGSTGGGGIAGFVAEHAIHSGANASLTLTTMAAALAMMTSTASRSISKLNLTNALSCRLVGNITTGVSGGKIIARYFSSASVTPSDWLDIGTSEVSLSLTSTGVIASSTINLAAGAKADAFFACLTSGGDGATSPVLLSLYFQFFG